MVLENLNSAPPEFEKVTGPPKKLSPLSSAVAPVLENEMEVLLYVVLCERTRPAEKLIVFALNVHGLPAAPINNAAAEENTKF